MDPLNSEGDQVPGAGSEVMCSRGEGGSEWGGKMSGHIDQEGNEGLE